MKKRKNRFLNILQHVKPYHLIILILLVLTNTMAWIIYSNTVSTRLDVHVRSWKVNFTDKEDIAISDEYQMLANDVYPGMPSFSEKIYVENDGEVAAVLSYTILKVQILNEEPIYSKEGASREKLTNYSDYPTSEELEQQLQTDYPFSVFFTIENENFEEIELSGETTKKAILTTHVEWPYEATTHTFEQKVSAAEHCSCGTTCGTTKNTTNSACFDTECGSNECYTTKILELSDIEDSTWGERAYTFKNTNPDEPNIKVTLILNVKQAPTS